MSGQLKLRVVKGKCATCVFGPNSPITPERFQDLRRQWLERGHERFQICHHFATGNSYDNDEEPEDDEAALTIDNVAVCGGWFEEMYVKRGVASQIVQVAERLDWLEFVDPPELPCLDDL